MSERLTADELAAARMRLATEAWLSMPPGDLITIAQLFSDHIAAVEGERDRLQAMVNRVIEGRGYVADDDEFIAMLDAHDAATRAEEGR